MVVGLLIASALAYFFATALFLNRLVRGEVTRRTRGEGAMVIGTALLLAAAVAGFDPTAGPHSSSGLAILFIGCAASGIALVMLRWADFPLLGPVTSALVGVVALVMALHALFPAPAPTGPVRVVTILHISATLIGYLLFVPAFVLGNLYLGQSWRLRTKQPSSTRLPPLVTLEATAWRLLSVGFVLYTLGIVGGWLSSETVHQAIRPQHVIAAISWLIYAVSLVRRYASGWRGARAAIALLAGFVVTSGAVLLYVLR